MIKKTLLLICLLITVVGCFNTKEENNKIVLDNVFYNKGEFIDITSEELNNLSYNNFILFAYNNYCSLPIPCHDIFKEYMEKNETDFLSINIDEYKKTEFYKEVEYTPTIIIVSNGKIKGYLNAESDDDLDKYQNINEFEKWINNYIVINN